MIIMENSDSSDLNKLAEMTIDQLSPVEKMIMIKIGRIKVSKHKNINKKTIYNKVPNEFHNDIEDCINNLLSKGLIMKYRNNNYNVSQLGYRVAIKLKAIDQKDKYADLRILFLV